MANIPVNPGAMPAAGPGMMGPGGIPPLQSTGAWQPAAQGPLLAALMRGPGRGPMMDSPGTRQEDVEGSRGGGGGVPLIPPMSMY
jgi:hypothetical protein